MIYKTVHTSLHLKDSPLLFHTEFIAVFNDDITPFGSIRNLAIKKTEEKYAKLWGRRSKLEIYYHDSSGNEVIIDTLSSGG